MFNFLNTPVRAVTIGTTVMEEPIVRDHVSWHFAINDMQETIVEIEVTLTIYQDFNHELEQLSWASIPEILLLTYTPVQYKFVQASSMVSRMVTLAPSMKQRGATSITIKGQCNASTITQTDGETSFTLV